MAEDRNFNIENHHAGTGFFMKGPVSMVEFNTTEGAIGIYKGPYSHDRYD